MGDDEEVSGLRGALPIAELLKSRGVRLDWVLDEGLLVLDGVLPGLSKPAALIGLAEKGYGTFFLSLDTAPGHSSMPPQHSAIGSMSAALARLEATPMPGGIQGVAAQMFGALAPEMGGLNRVMLSNLWLTGPLVRGPAREEPEQQCDAAHHHRADHRAGRQQGQRAAGPRRGGGQLPHPAGRHASTASRSTSKGALGNDAIQVKRYPGNSGAVAGVADRQQRLPRDRAGGAADLPGRGRRAGPDDGRHRLAPLQPGERCGLPLLAVPRPRPKTCRASMAPTSASRSPTTAR